MEFKEIEQLQKNYEESRKKFSEECSLLIKEATKKIFDEYPELLSFSWEQYTPYTPYFNDGDSCIFSVHEISHVNEYSIYEYEYGTKENTKRAQNNNELENNILLDYKSYPKKKIRINHLIDDLNNFIQLVPEFIMEDIFGDHSEITIYRDGTHKTEYCEHD